MTYKRGRNTRDAPHVNARQCVGCGTCAKVCYRRAISFAEDDKADIFQKKSTRR
ncbi:MAG: 4Fe-4S binding protein [Treponema sp.]|nr:4Fe-4S binding protein [Treponema sp.]